MKLERFPQPDAVECGPASVCTVFSSFDNLDFQFSIGKIIQAAEVSDTIKKYGTNVKQLAKGVNVLSGGKLVLLYKTNGTIEEIRALTGKGIPVVVDWQGSVLTQEYGEKGHYSTVQSVSANEISMIDSLPGFENGRRVSIVEFEPEWWDSDVIQKTNGEQMDIRSRHLYFIICRMAESKKLSQEFKLHKGEEYLQTKH